MKQGKWFLLVGLMAFIVLHGAYYSVTWEKNQHFVNTTNEYNETIQVAENYYGLEDVVPVRQFGENKINSHWKVENGIVVALATGLVIWIMFMKEDRGKLVPEYLQKQYVESYIRKHNRMKFITVYEYTHLQFEKVDNNKAVPYKREVFAQVEMKDAHGDDEGENYLCFLLDPYTLEDPILDILKINDIPTGQMKCQNCGSSPDFRERTPEGLSTLKGMYDMLRPSR